MAVLPKNPLTEGTTAAPVRIDSKQASELLRAVARQSVGLVASAENTEVVWVDGDRELAIDLANLPVSIGDGEIQIAITVRCDQTGPASIEILFAVGTKDEPSGLYASAYRRPTGPAVIVDAWGEPLVAFAWQCLLAMVSGVAGAVGTDDLGNVLVPVELTASKGNGMRTFSPPSFGLGTLEIVPMARFQLVGSQTKVQSP